MTTKPNPKLILITDTNTSIAHMVHVIEQAAAALEPGDLMVQHRDKMSPLVVVREHAVRLREVTRRTGSWLALNTIRKFPGAILDLAEEVGADGLHVECKFFNIGAVSGITSWVSTPAHTDEDVKTAHLHRVDAILVSPIFSTPGKGPPRGTAALHRAVGFRPRVFALGGIRPQHAPMCALSGAQGVAVTRALLYAEAEDVAEVARALAAPFREV